MEDFKSLFIATGVFAATMLTAAHLRFPNDSAVSYLMSSAQASPAHVAKATPNATVADKAHAAAPQNTRQAAPLFASLPLSAVPVRFEAPKAQAGGKPQVRRSPVRPPAGHRSAAQAQVKPAAEVVAENPVTEMPSPAKPHFDPLGDLLRGLAEGRAS